MKLLLVPAFAAAIVVASVAWGRSIETAIGRWGGGGALPRLSTGTAGCIGLAAFLCGSGIFVAINQYRPLFAWLWILAGCALAIRALIRRRENGWTTLLPGRFAAATLGVLGVEAVYETGNSLGLFRWNLCDDFAAYLPLLHRLSQTGGMVEPFSLRRIAGLGGATVFDSLFTTTFGLNSAYVGDFVVGALVVGLLLLVPSSGWPRSSSNWPRFALGTLLTVSFLLWEILKANLTPAYIPAALIAAAVLLIAETERSRRTLLDRRVLALVALLCAGLLTLRTPDAVPIALFGLVLIVWASASVRERLRAATFFFCATGLFAAPWMIALWRSSRTPLYPPIAGNFNNSWPGIRASGEDLPSRLVDALGATPLDWILGGILVAAVALIVLRRSSEWAKTPILAVCAAEVTAVALVVLTGAASHDLARYAWPFLAGVLVAALAMLAHEVKLPLRSRRDRTAVLVVLAVAFAIPIASPATGELDSGGTGIANVFSGNDDSLVTFDRFRYEYGVAQDSIPRGAKVAISADTPWYFNYDRNDLVNLDQLGAVSPAPRLPLGGSTEATTNYLRKQGFQFVIATDPHVSICLYSEKGWKHNVTHHKPEASMAPDFLAWFRWLRQREREAPRQATHYASLIVFDLRHRR